MVSAYNLARNEYVTVDTGFLIVKTFARLYADYQVRYALRHDVYALPRIDRAPTQYAIQYRGVDRDALDEYPDSDFDAEVCLATLAIENRAVNGFIFSRKDADAVYASLGSLQADYELIWSRTAGCAQAPPAGYTSAGFEPTYFISDHFSACCDCMLFPRWHGTDEDGELFLPYFRQLNPYGLFVTPKAAQDFLAYYRSFDWTETGEYVIAEVFIRP